MVKANTNEHTIEELEDLLTQIQEKFKWLGDYL